MNGNLAGSAAGVLEIPVTSVLLTWLAFEVGRWAQRRCRRSALMNPVLIAVALIIAVLEPCGISYETYMRGGGLIHFLLGPAAVALAVPIYDNIDRIRQGAVGILAGIAAGAMVACISAVACLLAGRIGRGGALHCTKIRHNPHRNRHQRRNWWSPTDDRRLRHHHRHHRCYGIGAAFRLDWRTRPGSSRSRRRHFGAWHRDRADPHGQPNRRGLCRAGDRIDRAVHRNTVAHRDPLPSYYRTGLVRRQLALPEMARAAPLTAVVKGLAP